MDDKSPQIQVMLQEKDINFLKDGMESLKKSFHEGFLEVKTEIKLLRENYVQRDDFNREISRRDGEIMKLNELIKLKLDSEDFNKLNKTLNRIMWIMLTPLLSAVVAGSVYVISLGLKM